MIRIKPSNIFTILFITEQIVSLTESNNKEVEQIIINNHIVKSLTTMKVMYLFLVLIYFSKIFCILIFLDLITQEEQYFSLQV